jgi:glycerol-3-phosphate dehydrogenase
VRTHAGSLSAGRTEELLLRYGTYASVIIADLEANGDVPLQNHPEYSIAEIQSLVTREAVVTLSDIVHRRTSLAFSGQLSAALVAEIADIMAPMLGWNEESRLDQVMSIRLETSSEA